MGGGENKIKNKEKEGIFLEISLDDYVISTDTDVSDKLAHELITGASTMQEWGIIVVDAESEKVVIT